ncbi:type 1 glutamine amidotransferase domain-containing protein [Parapedobacter sp. ISTM3]|uniref:type 1 glutamine amidotransferase domain-containing protein n=1 Tax=Parapedobacter sp. ISTM3 TaxID=2800130 RepID=UPI001905AC88|nr:type 1 glutamine amidotransferase domain-containing protein [Parapedobacter sp. ISTM3]MBK1440702.1 type 1 glutamine amidotransferase domain-containing protein [Parapedobacter sp. ISTM3]
MKKLLMILTSHADLADGTNQTGVWLSTFADAYYEFIKAGFEVTVASPKGGKPPVDPLSEESDYTTEGITTYHDDLMAKMEFGNTWSLDEVGSLVYDAVYIADGHGALWDMADDARLGKILYSCLLNNTPVAMVGHGVAATFALAKLRPDALSGMRITAFTDTEEALLKRHRHIPFSLTDRLKASGAQFTHAIIPFTPHVEADGIFITGQNPASAAMAAQELMGRVEVEQLFCG